ncbi:MAG: hypothetical protein Q9163_005582 [Psora crenata]
MCCWPYTEVILEDPPPKKKEEKKEVKPKEYIFASPDFHVQPIHLTMLSEFHFRVLREPAILVALIPFIRGHRPTTMAGALHSLDQDNQAIRGLIGPPLQLQQQTGDGIPFIRGHRPTTLAGALHSLDQDNQAIRGLIGPPVQLQQQTGGGIPGLSRGKLITRGTDQRTPQLASEIPMHERGTNRLVQTNSSADLRMPMAVHKRLPQLARKITMDEPGMSRLVPTNLSAGLSLPTAPHRYPLQDLRHIHGATQCQLQPPNPMLHVVPVSELMQQSMRGSLGPEIQSTATDVISELLKLLTRGLISPDLELPNMVATSTLPKTSPAAMHYPGGEQLYQSTLATPGPSHGKKTGPAPGGGLYAIGAAVPLELVPQVPTGNDIYYCKELNGKFSERTVNDIMNNCQPGEWRASLQTGFPFFERFAKE